MHNAKIRVLIADDEPAARRVIELLVKDDPDIEVVGVCANGSETVSAIERLCPDLVFLDIQMPDMDGFEALAGISVANAPYVIFVTAYDKYALRAFEVQAIDYLLKPFSDQRFYDTLAKAKARLHDRDLQFLTLEMIELLKRKSQREEQTNPQPDPSAFLDRIVVKEREQLLFIPIREIDWIESIENYVQLHTGHKTHLARTPLHILEKKLDPKKFVRIHRSTIVNLDRIRELKPFIRGDYMVILHDNTQLKLARRRKKQLERALGQSL